MSTPIENSSASHHAPTRCALTLERAGLAAMRAEGPERIVAIHGPVGAGKSHVAARIVAQHNAVFVRLRTVDTARTITATLCTELLMAPGRTVADSFDLVVRELRARPRLIIIDEFQLVVGARAVHVVRDLHDVTDAHFLVIGDDRLRRNLEQHRDRAFHDRVVDWISTIPLNMEDTRKLALVYAGGLTLADDLIELLRDECAGNTRLTVTALRRVVEFARKEGLTRVDAKTWRAQRAPAAESGLRVVR